MSNTTYYSEKAKSILSNFSSTFFNTTVILSQIVKLFPVILFFINMSSSLNSKFICQNSLLSSTNPSIVFSSSTNTHFPITPEI